MKTVVVGASPNPHRFSFKALNSLRKNGHEVIGLALRAVKVEGEEVLDIREHPHINDVHTLTIYVSAERLQGYEDYLLGLNPVRIIFNPGAENPELANRALEMNIEVDNACTLVMLGSGVY